MKKIFMLAMVSTVLIFCATAQPSFEAVKDTCSCQPPVKKSPPSPRPWKYVVEEKNQAKGLITGSFNDSIVIEDYTGLIVIPEVSGMNQLGRYVPPVSNLKEVKGSFNRYVNVKRFPVSTSNQKDCHQLDDEYWVWLPIAFFLLALIVLASYLISRKQQPSDPAKNQNSSGSNTPSPTANRTPVAPAVDIKDLIEKAATSGSTIVVHSDGSFKVIPPVKKEEKPGDVKSADSPSADQVKKDEK